MDKQFHSKTVAQSLEELNAEAGGLTIKQARQRLEQNGPNRLQNEKRKSLLLRVLAQFKDFLVLILIAAAIISIVVPLLNGDGFTTDELKDPIIIVAILLVNMVIGIVQENRADNALKELKSMSCPKAKVRRNGIVEKIDSDQVVLGDIVMLDAGDYIPADLRIIESMNLKIDEAALTGESVPVEKNADTVLDPDSPLGDRINLASMGTVVTYGRGVGVVCATGMGTEMGKIATILNETIEASTPLQGKLNSMAKILGIVCVVVCLAIFGIGLLRGMAVIDMMMTAVSLAVAAVPEGVAIVATVILALGVQRMVKSNVIVKKLRAVETLGSTTVICSDKTGTLTQNKMTVVKVFDTKQEHDVTGTGYSYQGELCGEPSANIACMAQIAVLCNDALYDKENASIIGDPTEGAMLVFGAKLGLFKDELNANYVRVQEIPFDSERKLMSTYNEVDGKIVMHTKGAPDAIFARASHVLRDNQVIPMDEAMRQTLLAQNEQFAAQALRVLAFAYRECDNTDNRCEDNLIYVGMMCMIDPPREEVRGSIAQCHSAGINVKMITGDHKTTAGAIAESLGIISTGDETLDGNDLNNLTDEQLRKKVQSVNVYARVSPEHKVRIINAVKENNNIVAMTGDGVNDAPSLKKADIGIAMGITGTDVSKEAADMILTDDNFVGIVSAVEQGRTIYGNIRKVTAYLLSCNIGEILIIFLAILFGFPLPLVPIQLLFVNLLTDAFPAFALGMEGREHGIMQRRPRDPKEAIINKAMRNSVGLRAIFLAAGCLAAFLYGLHFYDYATAKSICFFTLVASELLVAYVSKTENYMRAKSLFSNRFLNIAIIVSLAILVAVMYVPVLNNWFVTQPLSLAQLTVSLCLVVVLMLGGELSKRIFKVAQ